MLCMVPGAEVSLRQFGSVSRSVFRSVSTFLEGAEVSNGHFGTSAELSWARNVQGPKLSVHPVDAGRMPIVSMSASVSCNLFYYIHVLLTLRIGLQLSVGGPVSIHKIIFFQYLSSLCLNDLQYQPLLLNQVNYSIY